MSLGGFTFEKIFRFSFGDDERGRPARGRMLEGERTDVRTPWAREIILFRVQSHQVPGRDPGGAV